MTTNYINQTLETTQNKSSSKKANIAKTAAAAALITIAGAVHGQNSATIEPKYYKTPETAFTMPNLPNGSDFNLIIKAGEPIYVTIPTADANSGVFYKLSAPTRTIPGNTIKLEAGDIGNILVNYTENGVTKAIGLTVNYQADIYDRTPGSSTKNQRPEVIMVDAGQQATLSAGPNMNPTGDLLHSGYYKRKDINDVSYTGSPIDSVRNVSRGTYVARTNDGTGTWKNDTIAVIERPSVDAKAKKINFETTVNGVIYKVYKKVSNEQVVEVPGLGFTGNNTAYSVSVPDYGTYFIGAQRTANTETVIDTKEFVVDFTDAIETPTEQVPSTFKQANRELSRETEVPSIIYDIHGREMGTALASTIKIPDQATAGVYIVRFTENGKIHTKKIVIR